VCVWVGGLLVAIRVHKQQLSPRHPLLCVQVNTMSTFGTQSVQSFKELAGSNAKALGEHWAPGFEPNNPGQANFAAVLQAAAVRVLHIRTSDTIHLYHH
jgi:hypothetical protein